MDQEPKFYIKKIAVLGAGVMGAQIAAHFVNAGIPTLLFDLAAPSGDANGIVKQAIKHLTQLKPTPLATPATAELLRAMNYVEDLDALRECDLIIEVIAEKFEIKQQLYQKIIPYLSDKVIIASNTSGLSINALAAIFPEKLQTQFCGIHFFNPPRYMHLTEIIPNKNTKPQLLDYLETFLVTIMGKGVVRAKDTPNFIANRIGVFSLLVTLHHAAQFNLTFDVVDALTGTLIGRPSSATFRTMDVVGLDTMAHVINTMATQLPEDPWHRYFVVPQWLQQLITQGALGQKTGIGVYKKQGQEIYVLDLATQQYRLAQTKIDDDVLRILKLKSASERFAQLQQSTHPQAQFLWACYRDVFHYAAVHLTDIADNCREIDLAMRWGFGWQQGPFEIWQQAEFASVLQALAHDIAAAHTMATTSLPNWLQQTSAFYQEDGAWSPHAATFISRSSLPVYQRQLFSDSVLAERPAPVTIIFETADVKMWHQHDDIAILSFNSKLNSINDGVLDGILQAKNIAEQQFSALIIWQADPQNFSVGANLKQFEPMLAGQDATALLSKVENLVAKFQQTVMAVKYASIPIIAAVRGRALGGGCELLMHCAMAVCAFESYIGLVEIGVGLLPAGGGCKEFARRAAACAKGDDPFHNLQRYFKTIAMGEVSASAVDAQKKGYLRSRDVVVMNTHEVLYVAKAQARALVASNYLPPLPPPITVVGREGIATLQYQLANLLAGGYISAHDNLIATKIAQVLCGGDLDKDAIVDEAWLLRLEREAFASLVTQPKTQQRIQHMLETGKPLRN